MANVVIWSGVGVAIQSALGAAKTLTAITKANPGVITSVAHGFTNGNFILSATQGMSQTDGRVFRVSGAAADAHALEGEDTTLYDTFVSGTEKLITFGITAATFTGLTASGGDYAFIKTTTIHATVESQVPGLPTPATYAFESYWDVADAALIALKAASDQKAARAIKFTFSNGQLALFNGFVGCSLLPVGNAQDLVKTNVTITMFGSPTYYSA